MAVAPYHHPAYQAENVAAGVDPVLVVPALLVLALAIGVGVWRGRRHGRARGVKAGALTAAVATVVLLALMAGWLVLYYSTGGH